MKSANITNVILPNGRSYSKMSRNVLSTTSKLTLCINGVSSHNISLHLCSNSTMWDWRLILHTEVEATSIGILNWKWAVLAFCNNNPSIHEDATARATFLSAQIDFNDKYPRNIFHVPGIPFMKKVFGDSWTRFQTESNIILYVCDCSLFSIVICREISFCSCRMLKWSCSLNNQCICMSCINTAGFLNEKSPSDFPNLNNSLLIKLNAKLCICSFLRLTCPLHMYLCAQSSD